MNRVPLVPPGPPLTAAERHRYARHLLIPGFGDVSQRRVRQASVLVVGAGGLGAPVLSYLAAAGIGRLGIVDDDCVDETNLQRQVIHAADDVGKAKVESARSAIQALNPDVVVDVFALRLNASNALEIMSDYDVVVDGADNFPTRYVVGDACARLGIPHVWGSIYRFDAQVSVWWSGKGPCYQCVFPTSPPDGAVPSCSVGGVLGATCGAIGSVMAAEAVKVITGVGDPLVGRLLVHDTLAQSWESIPVKARPDCPVCGSLADPTNRLGVTSEAEPTSVVEVPDVSVEEAVEELHGIPAPVLLDVREPGEREVVAIDGSLAIPLGELADRLQEIPKNRRVLVHCKTGARSVRAVHLLRSEGYDAANIQGGIIAWVTQLRPDLPTY